MFYCIKCMQTHELANSEKLFATGFYHYKSTRIKAGYCDIAAQKQPTTLAKNSQYNLHEAGMLSFNNRREEQAQLV
jgi:hypothetical protein